jgi:hypothetical protein
MRRVIVSALALALLPAAVFAQDPPPAQQPPAAAAPAQPAAPQVTFKTNAGMLLVQVKPDQTAAFEEMISKLRTAGAASTDAQVKAAATLKAYKATEPGAGGNAFYVLLYDPVSPGAEYAWLVVINKTMTPEQQRDPATQEMYKRFAGAIAGTNILNLNEIK